MLFDWFTMLAQAANFVILVFLLKRFLYGPIVRAIAAREKRIAAAMEQAANAEREARRRAAELVSETQALAESKSRLLNAARQEVLEWRRNALDEIRREVEDLRRSWERRVHQDREDFLRKLKAQVAGQVIRISDKVLRDLADESVETRLVSVLAERLAREGVHPAAVGPVILQSGFPLEPTQTDMLRRRVAEMFPEAESVSFETCPQLGIGLRLLVGDRKVEWNLAHYLKELEKSVMAELLPSSRERQ